MEPTINRVLMGLGVLAGLLIGAGNSGGGAVLAIAAATAVWLLRNEAASDNRR